MGFSPPLIFNRIFFCPMCGEGPLLGDSAICGCCRLILMDRLFSPAWDLDSGFPVFSIFEWKGNSALAEKLIYALKDTKDQRLVRPFIPAVVSNVSPQLFTGSLLLSIPSSTRRRHSELIAKSLAARVGAFYENGLRLKLWIRQPGLSRKERMKREIFYVGEKRNLLSYNTVWVVDDIKTTGATMKAAHQALEGVSSLKGLTLFRRGLSI